MLFLLSFLNAWGKLLLWFPDFPRSLTDPVLIRITCSYFGFMTLWLTVDPPCASGKRDGYLDREAWVSFLYYAGGIFAPLVHGITYTSENPVSFHVTLALIFWHTGVSAYVNWVFCSDAWLESIMRNTFVLPVSIKSGPRILVQPLRQISTSVRMFRMLSLALVWINRTVVAAFLIYLTILHLQPQCPVPSPPNIDPGIFASLVLINELISQSAVKTCDDIKSDTKSRGRDWVQVFMLLAFETAWFLIRFVLQIFEKCPLSKSASSLIDWDVMLTAAASTGTVFYSALAFYVFLKSA